MKNIRRWFGWFIVVLVLHVTEQLIFGIDELKEVRSIGAVYYSWFSNPDYGSVVAIGGIVLVVQLLLFSTLTMGKWRFAPFVFFGVSGIGEMHHIVKTILHGAYFPGAVTAFPFAVVGVLLLRATYRAWQAPSSNKAFTAAA
jgi:hypothetical protein